MLEIKFEKANRVLGSLKPRSIYTQGCLLPSCPQTPDEVTVQLPEKPAQRLPHRLPLAGCSFPTAACWLLHCSPDLTGHPPSPRDFFLLCLLTNHMCVCVNVYIYVYIYMYLCICVSMYCTHAHTHTRMHARTHAHTCTQLSSPPSV